MKTLTSFRATTWNPALKLLSRLFTAVAFMMMLGASHAHSADMCYDPPVKSGFLCADLIGLGCTETTPIRNISSSTLTNTTIIHAYQGLSFDLGNSIGIDTVEKTVNKDGDSAEYDGTLNDYTNFNGFFDFNIFDKGIVYRTGDYAPSNSSNTRDQHTVFVGNLISMSFESERYLATYTKDNVVYSVPVPPCSGGAPYLTILDANVTEGNSSTKNMAFVVTLNNPPNSANDTVDLKFTTTGVTATGGTDYVSVTNSSVTNLNKKSFPYTFNVVINGDTVVENDEQFYLDMAIGTTNGMNAVLIDSRGTGTIVDDDNTSGGVTPPISSAYANVDVVDGYSGSGNSYSSWITTKVSAKPGITLNAVYLGNNLASSVPQPYTPSGNQAASITIIYKLADMSNGATCENAPTVNLNTTLGGSTPVVSVIDPGESNQASTAFVMGYVNSGTASLAKKDVRIKYKAVDFNSLIDASGVQCANKSSTGGVVEGMPACLITNSPNSSQVGENYKTVFGVSAFNNCYNANGQPCYASNGGVGKPPYDSIYGCYECSIAAMPYSCSKDNFAIRPEKLDINMSHYDYPNLLRSAQDYNATLKALNYASTINTLDYNVTDANSTYSIALTKYMKNNNINSSMAGTASFAASGFDMADGLSVKSGVMGSQVAGLSFDDVGKINISIQDQQWAAVDINNLNDTTPRDCTANGTYVCGDKNVTFIPERFDFNELNITNNNGNPGSFTYIANEFTQMGGRIHTQMRALNKNGAVTQNFAASPLWENNINVVPVVRKSTYRYPDANETTVANLAVGFGSGTDANGTKTIAWNETNTSQYLRFNFRRDVNQTEVPFDVNGSDLNISMTSLYVDSSNGHTATIYGDRNATGSGSSKFLYGRIIPRDVRVFGAVPFTANGWYEVYNAPNISNPPLGSSKNEAMWYINSLHTDPIYGDANVTRIQQGGSSSEINLGGTSAAGIETYNFNAQTPPYSAKAHIDTDPWLWYGEKALGYADPSAGNLDCQTHPCFNINIVPPIGATGSAKTETENSKNNKTSTSGGGTWHSTTDYAPAIR